MATFLLFYLSHLSCSSVCPGSGDGVVVPLDWGHGDCPCKVLDSVAGDGGYGPLLSGDVFLVSPIVLMESKVLVQLAGSGSVADHHEPAPAGDDLVMGLTRENFLEI